MGAFELIFIGMVLGLIIIVGLWFFATAMIDIGKNIAEKELTKTKEVKK